MASIVPTAPKVLMVLTPALFVNLVLYYSTETVSYVPKDAPNAVRPTLEPASAALLDIISTSSPLILLVLLVLQIV